MTTHSTHSDPDDGRSLAELDRGVTDSALRLCYVKNQWAWFTSAPLTGPGRQWGDDWNDAPYEHNAGDPYGMDGHRLEVVAFEARLDTPADCVGPNSRYSVEMINAGAIAWLTTPSWEKAQVVIHAGTTLPEFRRLIWSVGGDVYERKERE